MINVHVFDSNNQYSHSVDIDPLGPQPSNAYYGVLPEELGGYVRTLINGAVIQMPYIEPVEHIAPRVCAPGQGIVALFAVKGLTEADVHTAISSIPDPVDRYTVKIAFERATEWREDSPTMQTMQALLQLSAEDMDALFDYAVGVKL